MTARRTASLRRPPATRRTAAPHLDPYAVRGTMTLAEYRSTRARTPDVHVVLPLEDTTQTAA
jgi:hypothetical protein